MGNLYTFEIRVRDNSVMSLIAGDRDSIFMLAYILENSNDVKEFKVSFGADTNLNAESFGFGEFTKWVRKFNWNSGNQ